MSVRRRVNMFVEMLRGAPSSTATGTSVGGEPHSSGRQPPPLAVDHSSAPTSPSYLSNTESPTDAMTKPRAIPLNNGHGAGNGNSDGDGSRQNRNKAQRRSEKSKNVAMPGGDADPTAQMQYLLRGSVQHNLPPHRPKLIRMFLASSSASDFHLERECFWRDVFPELQQHCLQYGAELVVVDPFLQNDGNEEPISDPYYSQLLVDEIQRSYRLSSAVFFMCFLGDKYGPCCLPTKIRPDEYNHIRTAAFEATKDVRLVDEWYKMDNNNVPPAYTLVRPQHSKKKMDGRTMKALLETLQHGAHQAHKDGLINQINQKQQERFFSSLIELLVTAAMQQNDSGNHIFAVFRKFNGISMKATDSGLASFIDQSSGDPSSYVRPAERIAALKNVVAAHVDRPNTETFTATWPSKATTAEAWASSKEKEKYLDHFSQQVTMKVKQMISLRLSAANPVVAIESSSTIGLPTVGRPMGRVFDHRLAYEEAAAHLNWAVTNGPINFGGQTAVVEKVFEAARTIGKRGAFVAVQGDDCSGKTALICELVSALRNHLPKGATVIPRFVGLTAGSCFAHELWRHLCVQIAMCYDIDGYMKAFTMGDLSKFLDVCLQQVSNSKSPLVILLDDVHLIKYGRSTGNCPEDLVKLPLPSNVMFVCCYSTVHGQSTAGLPWTSGTKQNVISLTLGELNESALLETINGLLGSNRRKISVDQQGLLKQQFAKLCSSPCVALILAQEAMHWPSYYQDNGGLASSAASSTFAPKSLQSAIENKLIRIEQENCVDAVVAVCQYLTVAPQGLTETELLDVLSCNRDLLKAIEGQASISNGKTLASFPINVWLPLRATLKSLLTEVIYDGRAILKWKHLVVATTVKHRYLKTVQDIKKCHSDLADLYNDVWSEMGTSISMEDYPKSASPELVVRWGAMRKQTLLAGKGRRISVFPQPLRVNATSAEEPLFNLRRVKNLWYHLLHAGNIDYLKEQAMCNFLYLNAITQACGLTHLLTVMEDASQQVLHHDLQVLYDKVILPAMPSLANDRDQLGAEVIGRLRYSRAQNSHFLNSLVEQAMAWVDNYNKGPLVVPLTCWIKPPKVPSVTAFRLKGWTSTKTVLQPTINHQHLLVSGNMAGKGLIYMYHIPSQTMVKTFQGHTDRVTSLTLSSHGQFFVSTSLDKTVRTWDFVRDSCIRNMSPHTKQVFCSILTYDDKFVITGAADSCAKVIALDSGRVTKSFKDHTGPVVALALTSYSEFLITGAGDFEVKVWNLESGQLTAKMSGLMAPVTCMTLTSNDAFLIVSCEDETLRVFSLCSSVELHELQGHDGKVHSLVAAEDDCQLFAGCSDGKIYSYDLHTGEVLELHDCKTRKPVTQLKMTNDNCFLVSVSSDAISVWNIEARNAAHVAMETAHDQESAVSAIALSRDHKYAACATQLGAVALWDLEVCQCVWTSTHGSRKDSVTCLHFTPDSTRLLSGYETGIIVVWDMANGAAIRVFKEHTEKVCWIQVTSDSSKVYSIDTAGVTLIWQIVKNADDGGPNAHTPTSNFRGAKDEIRLCPNDRDLIGRAMESNKEMRIWTVGPDSITARAKVYHNDAITCTYLTTTGRVLVTGSLDQSLKVWDVQQGFLTQVLVGHEAVVTCCAAGDDERFVVSASADCQLIVWERSSGEQLHVIDRHQAPVTGLAVTNDGSVAISADKSGWIHAWDTETGATLSTFCAYMPILDVRCSFDANRIVLRGADCAHLPILCLHNTPAGLYIAPPPGGDTSMLMPRRGGPGTSGTSGRISISSLGSGDSGGGSSGGGGGPTTNHGLPMATKYGGVKQAHHRH